MFNIAVIVAAMKLTKSDLPLVKQLLFTDLLPYYKIAERYSVSVRTVKR